MTLDEVRAQKENILRVASHFGAYNIRLFGSTACGTFGVQSDIDLLVDLEPGRTLFDLGGLLIGVQEVVGRRVDVATAGILRAGIRAQIWVVHHLQVIGEAF